MEPRQAFVEVRYSDSGPGLAGAHPGTVQCARVIQVAANDERDAERQAHDRIYKTGTAGGISANFLRWV